MTCARVSGHGQRCRGAADRAVAVLQGQVNVLLNLIGSIVGNSNGNGKEASETKTKTVRGTTEREQAEMMIVSDRSIEQLNAARIALERANDEYAAWIERTGSSHCSDTSGSHPSGAETRSLAVRAQSLFSQDRPC